MPKKTISPTATLAFLGKVLNEVYEAGKPRFETKTKLSSEVRIEHELETLSRDKDLTIGYVRGALDILKVFGLITIDEKMNIQAVSRYAHFAIGSLSKFLEASICVVDEPVNKEEDKYLIELTSLLEEMRTEVKKEVLDQTPLHYRRIVNVIVKGKQIRRGKQADVYLHVFHPEWQAYHLVGLSLKNTNETDDDVARKAIGKQLGLKPDQYELDQVFNPKDIETIEISRTSGALTKYTFALRVAKKINVQLKLKQWMENGKFPKDWFRWFTWEEIRERKSFQNETIMFSTPIVLENIDIQSLPVSAPNSEDARVRAGIREELAQRFTLKQIGSIFVLFVLSAFLFFLPALIRIMGRSTIPALENFSNLFTIVSYLITFVVALYTIMSGLRK